MLANHKKSISEIKENLTRGLGKGLYCLVLYGSLAKGKSTGKSDIDLMLVVDAKFGTLANV